MAANLAKTIFCLTLALAASAGPAQATRFASDYVVTLYGLTIGRVSLSGTLDGDRYQIGGKLGSAGLARIFAKTDATAETGGVLAKDAARPERFVLDAVQGGAPSRTEIAFKRGRADSTTIVPVPEKPAEDVIPIARADLDRVVDPVSATLLAKGTPEQVCSRMLRVYEGGTRVDVKLSLVGFRFVEGVGNRALSCMGDMRPVAGMPKGHETWEYLRRNAAMEFVYVPAGGDNWLLHSLSAQTDIGRVFLTSVRRKLE